MIRSHSKARPPTDKQELGGPPRGWALWPASSPAFSVSDMLLTRGMTWACVLWPLLSPGASLQASCPRLLFCRLLILPVFASSHFLERESHPHSFQGTGQPRRQAWGEAAARDQAAGPRRTRPSQRESLETDVEEVIGTCYGHTWSACYDCHDSQKDWLF